MFGKKEVDNDKEVSTVKLGVSVIPEDKRKMYESLPHEFLVIAGGGSSHASRFRTGDGIKNLEEFADRIGIESVDVNADGSFSVMYDDDDIFAGHVVVVDGNMEEGLDSAYIEG